MYKIDKAYLAIDFIPVDKRAHFIRERFEMHDLFLYVL